MKRKTITQEAHTHVYAFERTCAFVAAFLLLLVQVLLPLAPVFAADEVVAEAGGPSESVIVEETDSEPTLIATEELASAEEQTEADTPPSLEENTLPTPPDEDGVTPQVEENAATDSVIDPLLDGEELVGETNTSSNTALPEDVPPPTTEEGGVEVGADTSDVEEVPQTDESAETTDVAATPVTDDTSSSTDSAVDTETQTAEDLPADEASSTPLSSDVVQPEVHTVTTAENRFSFAESECTTVGDGSFYCAKHEEVPVVQNTDRVFSAPDADGDREIYIEKDGALVQISHNTTDDDAPYYDEPSNSIVWHRLISERYQIVSYSIDRELETVLTADRYNNMQPTRYGDVVAWQGWVGNDWEIFVEENGERTMLTDNTTHDIAPSISGEYIIWQSEEGDVWKVKVYNRQTGATETIDDADALSLENPRLVLVYDAKHDNGDVETRGYDLKSGEVIPLSSRATPLPASLPDPDETGGEDKALVTQQLQLKTKTEDDSDTAGTGPTPDVDAGALPAPATTTASTTGDVVVPTFDAFATSTDVATVSDTTLAPEVEELVVPPLTIVTPQPVPDLIITPFVEQIGSTTDSQGEVAEVE